MNAFRNLLETRRGEYKSWGSSHCKALNQHVYFTMAGFNHLRFKIDNTPRNPREAMYKLGLLPLVRPVLYKATDATYERRMSPVGGSRKKVINEMEFWSLAADVGSQNVRVRVVLRRIVGSDQIHFWSVMKID